MESDGFPDGSYRVEGDQLMMGGGWGDVSTQTISFEGDAMTLTDESGWQKYPCCTDHDFTDSWISDW